MALDPLILVANPGSASRKYSIYRGQKKCIDIHFEIVKNEVVYTTSENSKIQKTHVSHLSFASTKLPEIIEKTSTPSLLKNLKIVALRVVAPSTFFQRDHVLNANVINRLERLRPIAPIHIGATLSEYQLLKKTFPKLGFVGISDSAFLANKPEKAMLYGIPYRDANQYDIKRFGYHGLSLESVVKQLKHCSLLPKRVIVCHLGGGCSVVAVESGQVVDSTMGFSPLEGVIMATRSGSIDELAYETIKKVKGLSSHRLHDYFNSKSGLLGISGTSSDIRDLLLKESKDHRAKLALDMFVYHIQKSIGAMAGVLGGVDEIVFTGTIGERSSEIRKRISSNLLHLGIILDAHNNNAVGTVKEPVIITKENHPGKIVVVHSNENRQIVTHALSLQST